MCEQLARIVAGIHHADVGDTVTDAFEDLLRTQQGAAPEIADRDLAAALCGDLRQPDFLDELRTHAAERIVVGIVEGKTWRSRTGDRQDCERCRADHAQGPPAGFFAMRTAQIGAAVEHLAYFSVIQTRSMVVSPALPDSCSSLISIASIQPTWPSALTLRVGNSLPPILPAQVPPLTWTKTW